MVTTNVVMSNCGTSAEHVQDSCKNKCRKGAASALFCTFPEPFLHLFCNCSLPRLCYHVCVVLITPSRSRSSDSIRCCANLALPALQSGHHDLKWRCNGKCSSNWALVGTTGRHPTRGILVSSGASGTDSVSPSSSFFSTSSSLAPERDCPWTFTSMLALRLLDSLIGEWGQIPVIPAGQQARLVSMP